MYLFKKTAHMLPTSLFICLREATNHSIKRQPLTSSLRQGGRRRAGYKTLWIPDSYKTDSMILGQTSYLFHLHCV